MSENSQRRIPASVGRTYLLPPLSSGGASLVRHSRTTRTAPTVGAIRPGDGQLYVSVIHPGDYGGKDVGFETGRVIYGNIKFFPNE
jgi:hypothetical protein